MTKIKYPRTFHLPYSEKSTSDDKIMKSDTHFIGKEVVASIKMDGENTTIYSDTSHARSLNSLFDSEDRRWIETFRMLYVENKLDPNMRICGENLFYKHTCSYDNLKSMFYGFSTWNGNTCLSWDDTLKIFNELNIQPVDVIYRGIYDKELILKSFREYDSNNINEGFVVRLVDSFDISEFKTSLNKFVKDTFVIPSKHWKYDVKQNNILDSNKNPWEIL